MKKLILAISCAGILFSCDSNKDGFKSSKNAQRAAIAPKPKTTEVSVSRLNSQEPLQPTQPLNPNASRLDSVINGGNTESRAVDYTKPGIVYPGVSGAGSGSSYASVHYAGSKKKKPKPTVATANQAPVQNPNANTEVVAAVDTTANNTSNTKAVDW